MRYLLYELCGLDLTIYKFSRIIELEIANNLVKNVSSKIIHIIEKIKIALYKQ